MPMSMDDQKLRKFQEKLRDAFADTIGVSEELALQAALEVAEEWEMRLREISDEKND